MKNISTAFHEELLKTRVDIATCGKLTRRDGTVFAFTSHDKTLTVGGVDYEPSNAFSASNLNQKSDLGVDNAKLLTLTSTAITEEDLRAGFYDGAELEIFNVIWSNLSAGTMPLKKAFIGEVTARQSDWEAEVQGLARFMNQEIVKQTSITCIHDLGDSSCQFRIEPPDWTSSTAMTVVQSQDASVGNIVSPTTYNGRVFACTTAGTTGGTEPAWNTTIEGTTNDGTVVWTTRDAPMQQGSVTEWYTRHTFKDANETHSDDHFKGGELTWLTGANTGLSMEVREFTQANGGNFTLWEPMPFDLAVGDTFKVHRGCLKLIQEDCITKFDNVDNFGGFPTLPVVDEVAQFPDAR